MLDQWLGPKDFAAKNVIFRLSKNANFVKNFAQNLEFCYFSPFEKPFNFNFLTALNSLY